VPLKASKKGSSFLQTGPVASGDARERSAFDRFVRVS
jgi:hypothetical protein